MQPVSDNGGVYMCVARYLCPSDLKNAEQVTMCVCGLCNIFPCMWVREVLCNLHT